MSEYWYYCAKLKRNVTVDWYAQVCVCGEPIIGAPKTKVTKGIS